MKYPYAWAWQAKYAPIVLVFVFPFLLKTLAAFGQTPYPLAAGPYTEGFDDLAAWTADFGAGTAYGEELQFTTQAVALAAEPTS